jgi:hypothetical protein
LPTSFASFDGPRAIAETAINISNAKASQSAYGYVGIARLIEFKN